MVDLLASDCEYNSPYAFSEDNVVNGVELEGLEYISNVPKFSYNGSWTDYPSAIDNGFINIVNSFSGLWNSGVANIKSLSRGTWTKDVGSDLDGIVNDIKSWAADNYTYTTNTPIGMQLLDAGKTLISPESLETAVSLLGGSKFLGLGKNASAIGSLSLKDALGSTSSMGRISLREVSAAKGGSNIKYLGRMEDLEGIPRSQTILDELTPSLGSPKADYYRNMSVIRKNLREGVIFKDASWFRPNSELAPTFLNPNKTVGQTFFGAERNLMTNKGLWP